MREHMQIAAARFPRLATDVPYVRVQIASGAFVADAELRSLGLIPVYRREDAVLAAYSPERDLRTLDRRIESYAALKNKLLALAKIEKIGPWARDDRVSGRIQNLGPLESSRDYTVDVLLLPIEGAPSNPQALPALESYVTSHRGRVVDRATQPTFTALRIQLGGQALSDLLDYRDDVALVDLPPEVSVLVPHVMSFDVNGLPETPQPPPTAPAICVVDSGILEGHPLLQSAILAERSRSFPATLGPPVPRQPVGGAGHGTQVAGIAVYADVGASALRRAFTPPVWLINARFLDDRNELHPDRMPFLREVVEHVRDRCRILNLSFGLEPAGGFPSVHAAELDGLAREYGVLFVVAAGNHHVQETFGQELPEKPYPRFLLDSGWPVLSPAEAFNVLTVGGITADSGPHQHAHHEPIAPRRAPSPFSRAGGLRNVVKPEVVDVAGNLAYDRTLKHWVDNDPGLRIPTTSPRFPEGQLLGLVFGTSFASPKVAHLASRILDRYSDATPNLLRALVVQSARDPEGVEEWKPTEILQLCGFGVPDLDRAMYCRPQRATLYYEGEVAVDEVRLFDIPVPPEFARARGRKSLWVTLAYDPPVSVVHRDQPTGVRLTWRVFRGDAAVRDVEAAIAAAAARDDTEAEEGRHDGKNAQPMKGRIPLRPQQRGTVQKNLFTWARGQYGDPYRLAVIAKATRPAHARDRQRFAVVVTLECQDATANVYTAVRARLAAGRVRVRIKQE